MFETTVHVFHHRRDRPLTAMSSESFWAFCQGRQPLEASARDERRGTDQVRLLLVTTRDGTCESVEPLAIEVDEHGFLQRKEPVLNQLGSLAEGQIESVGRVLDLRGTFISRYLSHAHAWRPDDPTLTEAIRQSSRHRASAAELHR